MENCKRALIVLSFGGILFRSTRVCLAPVGCVAKQPLSIILWIRYRWKFSRRQEVFWQSTQLCELLKNWTQFILVGNSGRQTTDKRLLGLNFLLEIITSITPVYAFLVTGFVPTIRFYFTLKSGENINIVGIWFDDQHYCILQTIDKWSCLIR
jgi:hypothetical protein